MSLRTLEKRGSRRRQAGMTMLGMVILAAFVGVFAFAGIRLTPVYLNYMKVVGVLNGVQEEFDGTGADRSSIRSSIVRRFDIETVSEISPRDIKVTKNDSGFEVSAAYEHEAPFIANVSFLVRFDKRVTIRR